MADSNNKVVMGERVTKALIEAEKKEFKDLDLQSVVSDLIQVGGFIRIAYTAAAGAPPTPEAHKIKMTIKDLGFNIAELCSRSSVTIVDFGASTKIILQELESTYEFLLEGYENMAVLSMASLAEHAKKMAAAALELHKECVSQRDRVKEAIRSCEFEKAREEQEQLRLAEKERELKRKLESLQEDIKRIALDEHNTRERRKKYQELEDKEIHNMKSDLFEIVTFGLFGGTMRDARERADRFKDKAEEELLRERAFYDMRRCSIQRRDEMASKIESCKGQQADTEIAIGCLHEACSSLNDLVVVLFRAAEFWQKLQKHCERLSEDSVKSMIKEGMNFNTREERLKFWTSKVFKTRATSFYVKWAALHEVCIEYGRQIDFTKEELFRYISENPMRSEARERLPALTHEYRVILKEELQRMVADRPRDRVQNAQLPPPLPPPPADDEGEVEVVEEAVQRGDQSEEERGRDN